MRSLQPIRPGLRALALALTIISGAGCAYVKDFMKPRPKPTRYTKAVVVAEPSPAKMPGEKREWFDKTLREQLFKFGNFKEGPELSIKYRILEFRGGNQAVRYLSGGDAGAAKLAVEVRFCHPDGEEIATMQRECKMESGLLGGFSDSLVSDCAREIAAYTNKNHYGYR